ncbi:MAG: hypothetical protein ABJN69_04755 [Hellea sp.]
MNENQKRQLLNNARAAITADTTLSETEKEKAGKAMEEAVQNFEVPNTKVYWIAVGSIAAIALVIVLGALCIAIGTTKDTPEFLMITLGTAVGALAGMLVPASR